MKLSKFSNAKFGAKLLYIAFLLFGLIFLVNPFSAPGLTSFNANPVYTGNDGWLTPANARSFVKVGGRIHWVFMKLHEGKRRIAHSYSEDGGRTFKSGALIAPFASAQNQYQSDPCIVSQSDGTLHIFYHEGYPDPTGYRIDYTYVYWIYSKDNGRSWSEPFKVSLYKHPWYGADPGNKSFSPSACVDKNDDIHLICCQGHRIGVVHYFYDHSQGYWTTGELIFLGWGTGDCRFPSIVADDQGNLHVLYGAGVWFYWDTPWYSYQKKTSTGWSKSERIGYGLLEPTLFLSENGTPLISSGYEHKGPWGELGVGCSTLYIRDDQGWRKYPIPIIIASFGGGQATIGSGGNILFPCCWKGGDHEIYQFLSEDLGKTWRVNFKTDDCDPSIGFNRNRSPRTAWSKYNFPRELATSFFFEKQTPSNPKEGPYELWFYPGKSIQDIITDVKVKPKEFDPYEESGEISLYYHLKRESRVTMEIFDFGGRLVKTLMDGEVREERDHSQKWHGIINCEEIAILKDDKGVLIAPDGIYTIKITAQDANDPSLSDTKEVKVKVKSNS